MALIYLDYSASTPMLPAVAEAMQPYLTDRAGNPASSHQAGRRARQALETAREQTAALLGAHPDEVVFASGATEANNLALFGLAGSPPGRLQATRLEHPSVLEPLEQLRQRGFALDCFGVNPDGIVDLDDHEPENLRLAVLQLANHETGAVQPVGELARRLAGRAPVHCDAAAAAGKLPIDFHALGVTTLTISAHKFHGPQGVGALLVRRHTKLQPLLYGGHQQQGRRPGTEPVALAVGLATALDLAMREREQRWEHVSSLRRVFLDHLRQHAAPVVVLSPPVGGVPHVLNVAFPECQADVLLMNLDLAGVCCSTGSACSSGSLLPSPVLLAMGVEEEYLRSAMRFSFSQVLSAAEVTRAARRIAEVVARLRAASDP
jgi:cysteine desulfurase